MTHFIDKVFIALILIFLVTATFAQLPQALSIMEGSWQISIDEVGGFYSRLLRDVLLVILSLLAMLMVFVGRTSWSAKLILLLLASSLTLFSIKAIYLYQYDAIGALLGNFRVFSPLIVLVAFAVRFKVNQAGWTRLLFRCVVFLALVETCFGLYQIINGFDLDWGKTWLGFKPIGTFGNYNTFSSFILVSFVMVFFWGWRRARSWQRFYYGFQCLLLAYLVLASGARTGMLALALVIGIEWVSAKKTKLLLFFVTSIPIVISLFYLLSSPFFTGRNVEVSRDGRLDGWVSALNQIDSISAVFFGNYVGAYTAAAASTSQGLLGVVNMNPHSMFMLFFANYGIAFSFLLLLLFAVRYFRVLLNYPGFSAALLLLFIPYPLIEMSPTNLLLLFSFEMALASCTMSSSLMKVTGNRQQLSTGIYNN